MTLQLRRSLRLKNFISSSVMSVLLTTRGSSQEIAFSKKEPAKSNAVLEEVVVTAPKDGPFSLQSVPSSSTILTRQQLESIQLTNLQELGRSIPNFSVKEGGSRAFNTIFVLRGLATTQYFSESPTSVYLDDIPAGRGYTQSAQLYEMDSVLALRGPQASLYGQNSEAGVILMKSKSPGDTLETSGSASYGNYNAQKYTASVMGPVIPGQLFLGISAYHDSRDGFLFNETLGTHPDSQFSVGGKIHLRWTPVTNWEFSLISMQSYDDDGEQRISSLNGDPFRVAHSVDGVTVVNANTTGVKAKYADKNMEITSISAYRYWALHPYIVNFGFAPNPPIVQSMTIDERTWSQEVRVANVADKKTELSWSTGMFFSREKTRFQLAQTRPAAGLAEEADNFLEDHVYAVFANVSIPLAESVRLSLGARLDYRTKDARSSIVDFAATRIRESARKDFFNPVPHLGLAYDMDDSTLFYGNTGLGFKAGGFVPFQGTSRLFHYDTEQAWTSEVGVKKTFLEEHLLANASFFYSDVHDYQFEKYVTAADYTVINIPAVNIMGGEFEILARPVSGWETGSKLGYTAASISRFTEISGANYAGHRTPYVPEYNWITHIQYQHRSGFLARLEGEIVGDSFYDEANTPFLRQGAYALAHGKIGYSAKYGGIYLFGRNLTDKLYYGFKSGALSAGTIGEPRTFGVEARFNF